MRQDRAGSMALILLHCFIIIFCLSFGQFYSVDVIWNWVSGKHAFGLDDHGVFGCLPCSALFHPSAGSGFVAGEMLS